VYTSIAARQVFDKLAHTSIMRLNENSMDKVCVCVYVCICVLWGGEWGPAWLHMVARVRCVRSTRLPLCHRCPCLRTHCRVGAHDVFAGHET
jgi:hypothetical protein